MLSHFLTSELFAFVLVFSRVGAVVMLLPGFGEAYVPARIRLMFALVFSLVLVPALHNLPPVPQSVPGVVLVMVCEIVVGLFLGFVTRIIISAVQTAGIIIALQSSLASSIAQDVTQVQGQASSLSNLLGITALTLMFGLDLHHLILRGIMDSYTLFLPGRLPMVGDMSNHAVHLMTGAFVTAVQIASPLIATGIILFLGAGILSRLVPNIQVFFLLMAPQILISILVLATAFSAMMLWFMSYFKTTLLQFLAPG